MKNTSIDIIKTSHHVFVCGANGTGKTLLTKAYTQNYKHILVLDSKGKFRFEPFLIENVDYAIVTTIQGLYNNRNFDKIVYRPNIHENNEEFYEKFFEYAYKRTNCIVIVDEAMQICTARSIPFWYKSILTRGREHNIGCWSCSQRPKDLHNLILTESVHWFVFRLNSPDDRDKLKRASGDSRFLESPKGHYFYYKNMDKVGIIQSILKFKGGTNI